MSMAATAGRPTTERRRFATFVVTGGIAAAANLLARLLLSTAMPYEAAIALAYLVGMATAYLLARRFVFAGSGRSGEVGRFALVNLLAFAQVLGVSELFARAVLPALGWRWHAADLAHAIGVASPVVVSYYLHKHFSFGGTRA